MKNLEKMLNTISAAAKVEETRNFFSSVLGIHSVCIGGSAALLLHYGIYLNRPVHDIDIIVDRNLFKMVYQTIKNLSKFFEIELKEGSSYPTKKGGCRITKSFSIVLKDGTEINVLVGNHSEDEWQSLEEIVAAKKYYNRLKDRKDLAIILG